MSPTGCEERMLLFTPNVILSIAKNLSVLQDPSLCSG